MKPVSMTVPPPAPSGAAPQASAARPGKSAGSVGQLAKLAVAEARNGGAELPRNAQGMAASAIAQGADPASVFAGLIEAPQAASETGSGAAGGPVLDETGATDPGAVADTGATAPAVEDGYQANEAAVAPLLVDPARNAVDILAGAPDA